MFNRGMTVGGYFDAWLEKVVKANVRYSTYTSYKGYIKNHIRRFLGGTLLSEIKPAIIQNLVGCLSAEGRIGARTIAIIIAMMSNAFGFAEDYEIIMKNPCRRIKLPQVEDEEVKVFSNTEQTKIENAIINSNDNRYYGVLIALYTGVRIGELSALRWENVDFENKCIRIKFSMNRVADGHKQKTHMEECEPKTKKSKRVIQLPDFIVKILRKLKRESNSEYVISMKNGRFVHPRTMQMLHKKLLATAGVSYANFHVLRHTFATRAAELNADPKTVSETLGHTNTNITLNRYTHSLKEQKQKMMSGFNSYFTKKKFNFLQS